MLVFKIFRFLIILILLLICSIIHTFIYRPANVLLRHQTPSNICTCIYHCNVNYMIGAVHKAEKDFPKDHKGLLAVTTCTEAGIEDEQCQFGICQECNKVIWIILFPFSILVSYWFNLTLFLFLSSDICSYSPLQLCTIEKLVEMTGSSDVLLKAW